MPEQPSNYSEDISHLDFHSELSESLPLTEGTARRLQTEMDRLNTGRQLNEAGDLEGYYELADDEYSALNYTWRTPESKDYWEDGVVGKVELLPRGLREKDMVTVEYTFRMTDQGLQVEKQTRDDNMVVQQLREGDESTAEVMAEMADDTRLLERHLGLAHVGEQGAQRVLGLLGQATAETEQPLPAIGWTGQELDDIARTRPSG